VRQSADRNVLLVYLYWFLLLFFYLSFKLYSSYNCNVIKLDMYQPSCTGLVLVLLYYEIYQTEDVLKTLGDIVSVIRQDE